MVLSCYFYFNIVVTNIKQTGILGTKFQVQLYIGEDKSTSDSLLELSQETIGKWFLNKRLYNLMVHIRIKIYKQ